MKRPHKTPGAPAGGKRKYVLLRLADFSKRYAAVFALVFGAFGGVYLLNNSSASRPTPVMYLTPETMKVSSGQTFKVQVWADSGPTAVNSVTVNLRYPANVLECVEPPNGDNSGFGVDVEQERYRDQPKTWLDVTCPAGQGKVSFSRGSIANISGEQLVATVTFKAKVNSGVANLVFADGTQLIGADQPNDIPSDILGSLDATTGSSITIGSGDADAAAAASSTSAAAHPTPGLYVTPSGRKVVAGSTFTVQVRADSGSTAVNGAVVSLKYPADLLECLAAPNGASSGFGIDVDAERIRDANARLQATCPTGKGIINFSRKTASTVKGDQLVASLPFKVKAGATTGTANLTFAEGSQLTAADTAKNILQSISTATKGGSYTLATPKRGDINQDGTVNDQDVSIVKLRWGTNSPETDIDRNGKTDIFDLSIVMSAFDR